MAECYLVGKAVEAEERVASAEWAAAEVAMAEETVAVEGGTRRAHSLPKTAETASRAACRKGYSPRETCMDVRRRGVARLVEGAQ